MLEPGGTVAIHRWFKLATPSRDVAGVVAGSSLPAWAARVGLELHADRIPGAGGPLSSSI